MKIILSLLFMLALQGANGQVIESSLSGRTLNYTQRTVSKNLFTVTNKIDTYFGDQKKLDEKNGSRITLEYATSLKERSVQVTEPDFDIKVRFKQLESKLNFKFNSVKEDEDETLQNKQVSDVPKDEAPLENAIYRASIGFLREQEKYWSLSFDTGIKVETGLKPFAKARGRRSFYFGEVELRLINRVLVEDMDGMFNYTDINIKRKLSQDFSFTYANKFVWKDSINELTTVHGPSVV